MYLVSTFYLSRIIGSSIFSNSETAIGKIADLAVEIGSQHPKVIGVALRDGRILDSSTIDIIKDNGQYVFFCKEIKLTELSGDNVIFLDRDIQDRQIVDTDGHKVVRVNDLRLAITSAGICLVAVDVGLEGLLRRLGIAKPLKSILKRFGASIPSKLILWDDVETIDTDRPGIKLSKQSSKLSTLHPSDLADIIEELDRKSQNSVFASFDEEKAADILEEMEPEARANIIESLTDTKAAELLEKMPSDEVADILDAIHPDKAERILREMNRETSDEVRELMEYPEGTVGSVMSTDYLAFSSDYTVGDVFLQLRRLKPEADTINYIYVVDENERLLATVSLRDLVISEPNVKLSQIMDKEFISVYDDDDIETLNEIVYKYNLLAVPVINRDEFLLGIVVVGDVVDNLLHEKYK
ncbi:CBS domain-containing protein [[Clostridium] cellulosi]|nr:MAG: CBS domain-containing protein [[Clostridium] cellulosi]